MHNVRFFLTRAQEHHCKHVYTPDHKLCCYTIVHKWCIKYLHNIRVYLLYLSIPMDWTTVKTRLLALYLTCLEVQQPSVSPVSCDSRSSYMTSLVSAAAIQNCIQFTLGYQLTALSLTCYSVNRSPSSYPCNPPCTLPVTCVLCVVCAKW